VTYTVTVTNMGPLTATGIIVTDLLPTNVAFVGVSSVGSNNAGVVTWNIGSLINGQSTNLTVTITAPASGSMTNIGSASAVTPDPNSANNNGTANNSVVVTTVLAVPQFGIRAGTNELNPQTGLFEQQVIVTNTGVSTVLGVRLYVDGLRSGVQFYNASGTNAGRPYAQYNSSLNPNTTVTFLLEFYVPDRRPFTNSLSAEALTNVLSIVINSTGSTPVPLPFLDTRIPGQTRFVIQFPTTPGKTYTIIYSDDGMFSWKVATPSITASANVTQWYDDGPPKTDSAPASRGSRFYAVIANP
jgi:uncharacterized repeat protein (TIGR01451 family)